ncbi:choline/ethanolamine kinase, putative [Theileria equi strain WA]|uniref:ethanolamine kinase n=1 Tax=Theileria equi strain WA TaxID=1537102 RepID=L1LFF2_THEEQ|nr:choline/ethanolamine kinase, putative [Theileria equi strain WA]EKX74086.1 choline/ethanolamine kinase, putative [Theileria equi strain WA]|eukprot:XP_004833538.1 choline/ethanolamine kinase, putative [Theileria equi strain WA]
MNRPQEDEIFRSLGPRKLSEFNQNLEKDGKQSSVTREECILNSIKLASGPLGIPLDQCPKSAISTSDYDYLSVEEVKGGITNSLYKVENTKNGTAVLVRIFGPKTSYIIDRERERIICTLLAKYNISKRVYAPIENGQIEEWINGFTLPQEDMWKSIYMNGIAINMKRLHSIPLNGEIRNSLQRGDCKKSMLWPTIWNYFDLCTSQQDKVESILGKFDFESLKLKIKEIEKLCNDSESPVVLCHCDLLHGNILVVPDGKVRFIDFEYSCPMERAFDIANHFNEYAGFACDWSKLPSSDIERAFAKRYLSYIPSLDRARGPNEPRDLEVSSESVDDLVKEIQPFYLASHAYWGIWSIVRSLFSAIDFDFASYAQRRIDMVFNSKVWNVLEL